MNTINQGLTRFLTGNVRLDCGVWTAAKYGLLSDSVVGQQNNVTLFGAEACNLIAASNTSGRSCSSKMKIIETKLHIHWRKLRNFDFRPSKITVMFPPLLFVSVTVLTPLLRSALTAQSKL